MIDTEYYRAQIGIPKLTDPQVVLTIRLAVAFSDADRWMSLQLRNLVRREWVGRNFKAAEQWAMSFRDLPDDDREHLRDKLFAVLEQALPPS